MSCCSNGDSEVQIEKDDRSLYVKILLLGTGESGKTTILKQMKILHINEFSDEERKQQISTIKQNIHESIFDILTHMPLISPPVPLRNAVQNENREFILNLGPKEPSTFSEEYFDKVTALWSDEDVKETFRRANEYQLIDSALHFLDRLDAIRQQDYIPTTLDMLFCRKKTIGINEMQFTLNVPKSKGGGACNFLVYDVGGQRGERRKWIQVFEGITAILFLIAASDFDQKLRKEEDENKNRLKEAFELFESMISSRYLRAAGMIVFLNKQDLLKKKIDRGQKIANFFPEFATYQISNNNEYDRARRFMESKVLEIAKKEATMDVFNVLRNRVETQKLPSRKVYIHHTIATDTNNIKMVLDSVQGIIIEKILETGVFVF